MNDAIIIFKRRKYKTNITRYREMRKTADISSLTNIYVIVIIFSRPDVQWGDTQTHSRRVGASNNTALVVTLTNMFIYLRVFFLFYYRIKNE